jgi:hypothetical protein
MALLSIQNASDGGPVVPVAASGGGDQIPQGTRAGGWDLPVFLLVRNGGAGPITATVAGHPPVNVPAGAIGIIPVFGVVFGALRNITYSGVTSVTVAAVRLSK